MYGGYGDDLLNADDVLGSAAYFDGRFLSADDLTRDQTYGGSTQDAIIETETFDLFG